MAESAPTSRQGNIVIFASGNGTNAENIAACFNTPGSSGGDMRVVAIITNRSDAAVIGRAERLGVPVYVVNRHMLNDPDVMSAIFDQCRADIAILAGFLLMIPGFVIRRFSGRMLNIHPSLLPRHGGHGMYGRHVHNAVVASGDTETGITIHRVSEEYDKGEIIFQVSVPVTPTDTAADIEAKVRRLEMLHYPSVIRRTFTNHGLDSYE